MARRRLTPVDLNHFELTRLNPAHPEPADRGRANVPRAEHPGLEAKAFGRLPPAAPIARVAAEAASAAALEEMAETLARARDEGRMVVDLALDQIAPDHLSRDRIPLEDEDMVSLRESIRLHGQRTPIEVTPLAVTADGGTLPYGLISGWRRLTAFKALHAETGEPRFATLRALIRRPETAVDAYVAMVEENEIRVGLSQYERARVAAIATQRGIFASEKAALLALFATASRAKRSRIRAFLDIYHALDGTLRFPQALPERLGLKLVEMVRAGERELITHAIARDDPRTPEAELELLTALVAPLPPKTEKRPTLADQILPGVTLETRLAGRTLTLKLKGKGVTPEIQAEIRALLMTLRRTR